MESFGRTCLLLSLLLCILSLAVSFTPTTYYYIDCGATTSANLTHDNPPRTFIPDDGSNLLSGNSFSLSNPNNSSTSSLYNTATVSSSNFEYHFIMEASSSNVIRLHFLPFSAKTHDLSSAKFSVRANSYMLLENFSVSETASPTIKEFFLWTDSRDLVIDPRCSDSFREQVQSILGPY